MIKVKGNDDGTYTVTPTPEGADVLKRWANTPLSFAASMSFDGTQTKAQTIERVLQEAWRVAESQVRHEEGRKRQKKFEALTADKQAEVDAILG